MKKERKVFIEGDFSIKEVCEFKGCARPDTKTVGRKNPMGAEEKIAALKAAGVNVDGFFSMRGANGGDAVAKLVEGKLVMVSDDDPIFNAIRQRGNVPDRRLYRRWVLAQIMHMVTDMSRFNMSFTECMALRGGYKYQWKVVEDELRVQSKLATHQDTENLTFRSIWYNKDLVVKMIDDYVKKLEAQIGRYKRRNYKGKPYIKMHGKCCLIENLDKEVYLPIAKCRENVRKANTATLLYLAVQNFNAVRNELSNNTKFSVDFIDAYKGCGAYYAMKNLIMFHGLKLKDTNTLKRTVDSLKYLDSLALINSKNRRGWRMLGIMKEMMEYNGFDIEGTLARWSAEKMMSKR